MFKLQINFLCCLLEKIVKSVPALWLWFSAIIAFEWNYNLRDFWGWGGYTLDQESRFFCWGMMGFAVLVVKLTHKILWRRSKVDGVHQASKKWASQVVVSFAAGMLAGNFWLLDNTPQEVREILIAKLEYQKAENVGIFDPNVAIKVDSKSGPDKIFREIKQDTQHGREFVSMEMAIALTAWIFCAGLIALLLPYALSDLFFSDSKRSEPEN